MKNCSCTCSLYTNKDYCNIAPKFLKIVNYDKMDKGTACECMCDPKNDTKCQARVKNHETKRKEFDKINPKDPKLKFSKETCECECDLNPS